MGRRSNFLNASELSKVHQNSKTYEIDYSTSLDLFTNDCKLRNLRPYTITYYLNELKVFERYLIQQDIETNPSKVTREVIQ